jgi:hypothetical protein
MKKYNQETQHNPYGNEHIEVENEVQESMWNLFKAIGKFWTEKESPESMKSGLVAFMRNRISLNATYRDYYRNAQEVIDELIAEYRSKDKAYEFLFTYPGANIQPPGNKLAYTRQMVSNEFITLYLALGGFKHFGGALNYQSYFGGANIPGDPPYRTYKK